MLAADRARAFTGEILESGPRAARATYDAAMKTSGWLYLAGAAFVAVGLLVFWPALIVVPFIGFGARKQSAAEKQAAVRAQYAHTRRT